ncbi:MAG: replicative DNA helicase [Propionibacterium sp.]|nr:replicative DNA helicase [Propionibacterium sp.]
MYDEPSPAPSGIDRTPPQDFAAEQGVLGAMLMSKDAIAEVLEVIKPADFYRPSHELIYQAIVDLYGHGDPADPVTVAAELDRRGELSKVGGHIYLADLLSTISVAANAAYYAQIVHDKAVLRRLVDASIKIAQLGYAGQGEVADIVDTAQQTIYEVSEGKRSEDYKALRDLLEPTYDEIEAIGARGGGLSGVPTGFAKLDELTNGLHGGQMIIIAARPAVGKSTLALDFARSAAIRHKLSTAFFSLEMSQSEIVMRLLAAESGVMLNSIRNGGLGEDEWSRIVARTKSFEDAPLFIDDSPNLTMMEIRAKARRLKQRHDLRFVVIDYMQLMSSGKKVESRQLEVSEFSRQIKLLAKELDIPVVALSQLNRGPEQRGDKKPMMSDLRESGSLEQDADIVILLHREDLYDKDNRPGEADLIIAKHRNGRTDTLPVSFQGHFSRFADMPS